MNLNMRTLTTEELLNNYRINSQAPGIRFYDAVQAAFELARRLEDNQLIPAEDCESKIEDAIGKAFDDGVETGIRDERNEILDYLTDYLMVGKLATELENGVAEQIVGRMRREFPELTEKEAPITR
jgi:hypothetical protein